MTELTARELLVMLYQAAIDAVDGRFLVAQFLQQQFLQNQSSNSESNLRTHQSKYTHCVAVGKAAAAMLQGALDQKPSIKKSLLICPGTKIIRQLSKNKTVTCIASSHPVPDEKSIEAGKKLLDFLLSTTEQDNILFLISGGASSLVEVPVEGMSLEQLQKINRYLLASGKNIHQINSWRQQFSQIKGGGLLNWINSPQTTQLLLSDVKDDLPEFIGSGLLVESETVLDQDSFLQSFLNESKSSNMNAIDKQSPQVTTHIVGNIKVAMQAVSEVARNQNLNGYIYDEFLEGNTLDVAKYLYHQLKQAEPGIHIWGGETTMCLPIKTGIGGRNLTLALAFAQYIKDEPTLHLLAAGTDGVDGNSSCAGGIASIYTSQKAQQMGFDIQQEIEKANAGMVLMATDDLVVAQQSNTNVMDIVIAYKLKD